jgi:REP element-mobilizing transposase RayT
MPCYLFTYHGHGTWLPDHSRGYVRRKVGVLAMDVEMGQRYRENLAGEAVYFDAKLQSRLVEGVLYACGCINVRCHAIATDSSHIHLLLSWKHERPPLSVSLAIKTSLTRRLNEKYDQRTWFSKGGSRKRVTDQDHFDYLMNVYLPRHRGAAWFEKTGDS